MATDKVGQWGATFDLDNVAIHAHLLPNGTVLYWGRRDEFGSADFNTLNDHFCSTFLWDPITGEKKRTAQSPQLEPREDVNLFCSGHSFLPDGRLLVVGGHLFDSVGVDQACIYDALTDGWTALPRMSAGRWYPSALTLPDGGVLAVSGSFETGRRQPPADNTTATAGSPQIQINADTQIWCGDTNTWASTARFPNSALYPRLHVEPLQGHVFMAGPLGQSYFLDINNGGSWTTGPKRTGDLLEYASSVMYQSGKILYIGGGETPTNMAEIINLNDPDAKWQQTMPMNFSRRQHNAVVLPDSTVLVTGGTQSPGFNNVEPGGPVHQAELWDPATEKWTLMAQENTDRCYHSIALLLPDGRVLSAGGGEWAPTPGVANPQQDSHRDAQIYSPPYLFNGDRPTILTTPAEITYGKSFNVTVDPGNIITNVSWIRLGSVTHSFNQSQMLVFLNFQQAGSTVMVQAPANVNIAPPGHYMLFVLNEKGVPSIARITRIVAQATVTQVTHAGLVRRATAAVPRSVEIPAHYEQIKSNSFMQPVVVGVTPSCPYGIGACWGGAFDALNRLETVRVVRPLPDTADSTAFLYLKEDVLPDLNAWHSQFAKIINGTYTMRGIEMKLCGVVTRRPPSLILTGTWARVPLELKALQAADKIQWDFQTRTNKPILESEASAFTKLFNALAELPAGTMVQVTGPLQKTGADFFLQVREFKL